MKHNVRESYKVYKELSDNPVPIKEYVKVNSAFAKFIAKKLMQGFEMKLPAGLGAISVKGKKVKPRLDEDGKIIGQAPNYKATLELWEKCPECKENKQMVFHLNEHTDHVRYKFFWSKERMLVENKMFYTLIFTRTNKRKLSRLIKQGKEFYVEPSKKY